MKQVNINEIAFESKRNSLLNQKHIVGMYIILFIQYVYNKLKKVIYDKINC